MARVVLIGLDGMDPALAERWMADGRLPNLDRLRREGSYLPCESVKPPVTFPAWTTCVTGVNPGKHGIFDFTTLVRGEHRLKFINSSHRRAPAVWNILSAAGKRVAVIGVPGTYPPEPINGIMVSGFDSPVATSVDRGCVYPPDRFDEVRHWRFADFQESHIGPGWHAKALEKLHAKINDKEAILVRLLQQEPWDFFMTVFGESDTVAHHFWLFHDPDSPRHLPGFEHSIRGIYERLDTAVGRLMASAGSGTTVMVVSDHGFGGSGTGVVHMNNWLAENGYLHFAPGRDSVLKKVALRAIPTRWRGALFRRMEGVATLAESRSRFAGIDWARTTAWSEELNYFPTVRVNVQGRDPYGLVPPEEYDDFCNTLCKDLMTWEAVAKAYRNDAIYHGPYVREAPDIIVELALENGYSHSCLRKRGGPPFRRLENRELFGGKERGMTGNHRPMGVFFSSRQTPCGYATLEDIAPSVLAEIGIAGPDMDGTSLFAAYTPSEDCAFAAAPAAYSPDQERQIEQRLRDLGYLE
ncbi:MAG: hypothetical protein AMXMBFR84_18950 [Candidatus Hydrogenedentota bacterium]